MRARPATSPEVGARLAPVVLAKYMGIASDAASWVAGETNGCIFRVEPRS
jgi:hypothetical protein